MSSFVAPRSISPARWTQNPLTHGTISSTADSLTTSHPASTQTSHNSSSVSQFMPQAYNTRDDTIVSANQHSQGLRLYADTLQPPQTSDELLSPTFSIDDWLTPEASSDNQYSEQSTHTTPGAEQYNWQEPETHINSIENFDPAAFSNTDNGDFLLSDSLNALDQEYTNKTVMPERSFLLTPDPTSTSGTPDRSFANTSTTMPNLSSNKGLQVTPQSIKRSRADTESAEHTVSDGYLHSSQEQELHHLGQRSISQAVSPSVLITSHSRGDSPARSQVPLLRTSSKRSQSSRLSQRNEVQPSEHEASTMKSSLMPPDTMENDEWHDGDDQSVTRSGHAPGQRDAGMVPSLKDLEKQRELDDSRAEVENWLAKSEAGSSNGTEPDRATSRNRVRGARIRSRSTGARHDAMGLPVFDDSHIPGPNILVDESSTYYYSSDESELGSDEKLENDASDSPPAEIDRSEPADESYFPPVEEEIVPDEAEPLPRQFYRKFPWQDPVRGLEDVDEHGHPPTANAAMFYYDRQAAKFETASRAATWGTRRRLSDSEIASIIDGSQVSRHLSLKDTIANRARARVSHTINTVKNSMPRRSSSFIKKRQQQSRNQSPEEKIEQVASPEPEEHRNSVSSTRPLHRMSSSSKRAPKSPPLNTGGALMAMTGHLAAVGGSSAGFTPEPEHLHTNSFFSALKRVRSKSEVVKTPKAVNGPSEQYNQHLGQELLASPLQVRDISAPAPVNHDEDLDDDDEDDEIGIKMEMPMQPINILPTLEGFKTHVRQLNPRLKPFLIDRIATDQLRRYKKLVKNRVEHAQTVQLKKQCPSGKYCMDLGGKATILPPRSSSKDSGVNFAQFKIAAGGDSEGDEASFADGVVTPALFPPGIPQPPTTHLPAEFECPLCFQVKKFQKPSDWTKHVHEDVQPFSCTFPKCPEPKSFKRKADWVRHENERHRHLEWWTCNIQDCKHVCYRKDNFVQHLVREHKMNEPKGKAQKATTKVKNTSRSAGPSGQPAEDFWHIVESCRHENQDNPRDEPCKFCDNRCSTWKKLSVHVGKHMEQIAMPVLELARTRQITVDTVISPVEAPPARSYGPSLETSNLSNNGQYLRSPYTASAHSPYQGSSSAGHSPAAMPANPRGVTPTLNQNVNQGFYQQNMSQVGMQQMPTTTGAPPISPHINAPEYRYPGYGGYENHNYMPLQQPVVYGGPGPGAMPGPAFHPSQVPRSQPVENYHAMAMDPMQNPMYNAPQYYPGAMNETAYVANYGHDLAPQGDLHMNGQSGPSSHGHTPVSTGPGGEDPVYYAPHQPGGYQGR